MQYYPDGICSDSHTTAGVSQSVFMRGHRCGLVQVLPSSLDYAHIHTPLNILPRHCRIHTYTALTHNTLTHHSTSRDASVKQDQDYSLLVISSSIHTKTPHTLQHDHDQHFVKTQPTHTAATRPRPPRCQSNSNTCFWFCNGDVAARTASFHSSMLHTRCRCKGWVLGVVERTR